MDEDKLKSKSKTGRKIFYTVFGIIFIIGIIILIIYLTMPSQTDTPSSAIQNKSSVTPPPSGTTPAPPAPAPPAPAPASGLTYNQYKGQNSGKCLNISGGSTADGSKMIQYDCTDVGSNSMFGYNPVTQELKIKMGDKCVDVSGGSTIDGAQVQSYSCNSTPAQKWTLDNGMIKNVGSGKCMNVSGDSHDSGANIITWSCDPNQLAGNEIWSII
jgi:hypothetical protein